MKILKRLSGWLRWMRTALTPSETAWRGAVFSLWVLAGLIALAVLTTYVLPDFSFGKLAGFAIVMAALLLAGLLLRLVVWLLSLLPRRYRASLFLLLPLLLMLLAPGGGGPKGAGILLVALVVLAGMLGGTLNVLRREGLRPREQRTTLTTLGLAMMLLIASLILLGRGAEPPNPALADFQLDDRTLDLPDPGQPGDHVVGSLTYGSGKDLRRPEYGDAVDLVSRSVDGSKLIDNWEGPGGWLRTLYWGFDAAELPLQARVWHPEGDGPFPLVLIVHGNHGMEDFSDPGYAYLGELMASRGYIFASVDENFLNSSISDLTDVFGPGLEEENDARGWLLLEHLDQWSDWNADPESLFFGKVNMDRVALIGHSRGGEAVAVAAAFNSLDRYPDDATLDFDYGFGLRGVIAIAPVDRQYEPREDPTPLENVNYFTIHGSLDGDVQSFMGTSQYSRNKLTRDPAGEDASFKAALYIVGANHGQFNTSWGRNDFGGFWGWFLDTRPIMDPEEQRQIARVYFSAFLEVVLRDNRDYLPIFQDGRLAAAWLPDNFLIQNFADSGDVVVANFEEDLDPGTTTLAGGRIDAEHLTRWREERISLKYRSLDSHAAVIAWNSEAEGETASFAVTLPPAAIKTGPESRFFVSLSATGEETLPKDWEEDEEAEDEGEEDEEDAEDKADADDPELLDWTIVLTDAAGEQARLPLSHDRALYPQILAVTRRASFLDSIDPEEPLFHRRAFRLGDFIEANPMFDASAVREIRFVFDASEKGAVMIDDLGFELPLVTPAVGPAQP